MDDLVERASELAPHSLGWRLRRDEGREGRLEGDEPAEELVVFGVGDDRRVRDVVGLVGLLDLSSKIRVARPCLVFPERTTERLLLRGWRDSDRDDFGAMNADPEVMEHFPSVLDRAASDALMDRIAAHWAAEGFGLWAVERLDDRRLLGFTGLSRIVFDAPFTPAVEVGWRLGRAAWGHGFATEAGSASLVFGFEDLGLDEIVSFTAPVNTRSIAVMERLGMTRDPAGDFEHPRLPVGHPLRPHVLYRLQRSGWERDRRASAEGLP